MSVEPEPTPFPEGDNVCMVPVYASLAVLRRRSDLLTCLPAVIEVRGP